MLSIRNLSVSFNGGHGHAAVDGIDLDMQLGDTLGLVGESGSGKTVTALTIAGLINRDTVSVGGKIFFDGTDILASTVRQLRKIQGKDIGVIFQEPMTSLDPLMRVGKQVEEAVKIHSSLPAGERREMALAAMRFVDLNDAEKIYKLYPHQLSGGQRQRAMIASALINGPKLLILDEPTTALDVTVQAQIIDLLKELNEKSGVSLLFISHDLRVVRRVCKRVAVMYRGKIVEQGEVEEIFRNPRHEYTKSLLAAAGRRF